MKIYIPKKLISLKDILIENGYQKEIKHINKYLWFVSKIATFKIFNKTHEVVHLNNKYLRRIIGTNNTSRIKKILEKLNIVLIDKSYQVNNYSKSYEINEKYISKLTPISILDNKLEKNIEKWSYFDFYSINKNDNNKIIKNNLNTYNINNNSSSSEPYEDRYFDLFLHFSLCFEFLTIEHEEAEKYISYKYINEELKYIYYSDCITFIKEKYFFKIVDPKTGRFYTNITNLPKDLRQFLRYKGEQLIEIDIANSQPFLFNLVISNYSKSAKLSETIGSYKGEMITDEYRNVTERGKIYEYFTEKWNTEYSQKRTREEIKETFFKKIFFCTNKMNERYPESKLFQKVFPTEYKIIVETKKNDYKYLAYILQKLEAEMIIYTICLKLIKKIKDIGIFTIHDSILTTINNIEIVKQIMLKEFQQKFSLMPILKIKSL